MTTLFEERKPINWNEYIRCSECGKALFKIIKPGNATIEVKCKRCKKVQEIDI